ncbi:DUF7220 family protein [Burkholderia cepacia]|uniref:DUF7220 family protein n=1 Tax=Burkholderia cepacia TaxID=292 RepID=UPI001F22CD15|nr:hypothetical protein [Burkholderia cepacia]UIY58127.1 hypothetical protein LZ568_07905 [Burkholderia cepacia]
MIEAATSAIAGCMLSMVTNYIVLPHYGMRVSLIDNISLTGIYTAVSFFKGYAVRRGFERFREWRKG